MNHLKPEETLQATINAGAAKAAGSFKRLVILGLLAGSFIALAGCAANMATFNLLGNPDTFGIGKAFSGVIFTGGLIMVVLAGGELFTGNCLMMKSGQGASAAEAGALKIGAVTALNALGDVFDGQGRQIAGLLSEDGNSLASTSDVIKEDVDRQFSVFSGNTTISCIITNARLTKAQCTKLASIAHDGYARAIKPVHSTADGDTIFVMATGEVEVNFDAAAVIATEQISKAIENAALSAEPAYGLKNAKSLIK